LTRAWDMAGIMSNSSFGRVPSGTTANRPASPAVGDQYYNGTIGALEVYTSSGWKTSTTASGNTAGRPANPYTGQSYFNGETQRLELYTASGSWENIVQEVPGVSSITGNYSQQTDSGTIVIYGTNFVNGAYATAIGTNGVQVNAASTTFNSLVQLTATFAGLSNANEPYDIKVTNPSNLFGIIPDALYVNASPVWTTSSGSLGTFNEQVSISVSATATDSDSTITYALASGSTLPSGVSLNSSSGLISGTLPDIEADTTYNFTINASDGVNAIPRAFSITSSVVAIPIEYLVVGGGGGGGTNQYHSGGGGAGGFRTGSMTIQRASSYTVTVGLGAVGWSNTGSTNAEGRDGNPSVFSSITAAGGGGGAGYNGGNGRPGGSGGGGGGFGTGSFVGGTATPSGQGNNGGKFNGTGTNKTGGGGGGAGAAGSDSGSGTGGHGGAGLASSITGTSVMYAGGGGGSCEGSNTTNGGAGGGGGGSVNNGTDGAPNTGGGGGAGERQGTSSGGGGSGIVVIAYPNTYPAIATIPGTLTYNQPTRAGYRVYRFTAGTGSITI
jgi:hypothetical protein